MTRRSILCCGWYPARGVSQGIHTYNAYLQGEQKQKTNNSREYTNKGEQKEEEKDMTDCTKHILIVGKRRTRCATTIRPYIVVLGEARHQHCVQAMEYTSKYIKELQYSYKPFFSGADHTPHNLCILIHSDIIQQTKEEFETMPTTKESKRGKEKRAKSSSSREHIEVWSSL